MNKRLVDEARDVAIAGMTDAYSRWMREFARQIKGVETVAVGLLAKELNVALNEDRLLECLAELKDQNPGALQLVGLAAMATLMTECQTRTVKEAEADGL